MLHAAGSHVSSVSWLRKQHTVAAGDRYLLVDLHYNKTVDTEYWAYMD